METPSGEIIDVEPGASVYGSDGDKLGSVIEIGPDYFVVEKGLFFPTDYFVPNSAIASVEPDRITLAMTKDEALDQGWDKDPTEQRGESVETGESAPDRFTGDFDGVAVTGFGPADDSGTGDPVKPGFATQVGTTPPAADFETLGVAPVDVNTGYTGGNTEPVGRDTLATSEESGHGQRQDDDRP